ncbi:S8 family serine peptidase [Streptomyces sp. NPDC002486]
MPSVETTPSPKQPARPPPGDQHGTHIAGIIGGWWPELDFRGICPRIRLYDVRVLDDDGGGDEFSIVTALQAIRHINEQARRFIIAGVSISLSVPHDVASHSTGWTPVCVECDRLARSGVVVVTAAGNSGFTGTARTMGADYRDISISDPGNAESVITVGSTHRSNPHRHGVSYFSSRGPTGDGRPKPGLVAPGEDIDGPIPGEGIAAMHGTSQAAAHVSGAAAMLLLARNRELLGPPERLVQLSTDFPADGPDALRRRRAAFPEQPACDGRHLALVPTVFDRLDPGLCRALVHRGGGWAGRPWRRTTRSCFRTTCHRCARRSDDLPIEDRTHGPQPPESCGQKVTSSLPRVVA